MVFNCLISLIVSSSISPNVLYTGPASQTVKSTWTNGYMIHSPGKWCLLEANPAEMKALVTGKLVVLSMNFTMVREGDYYLLVGNVCSRGRGINMNVGFIFLPASDGRGNYKMLPSFDGATKNIFHTEISPPPTYPNTHNKHTNSYAVSYFLFRLLISKMHS